ncbi:MAG: NADH:ubiquinone reductase (Na(+)-transporting) subunit A [Hoeflea sp.]|nr:NADH:ubiquinone reductase (Na(+)-transporting) subunit A [Hoeflea sp.]
MAYVLPWFRTEHARLPEQTIHDGAPVGRIALLGADLPGLRPKLLCEQGSRIKRGQAVFHDRAHPEVVFASPVSGVVESITLGPRRSLSALVIRSETGQHEPDPVIMAMSTAADVRAALLAKGFWAAFLTRPFGRIPEPDAVPDAIFVTVTADNPHAPDPRMVLAGQHDVFAAGLKAVALLTEGTVHVCQAHGADIAAGLGDRIRGAFFPSDGSCGLAGTHIHRLYPVGQGRSVWSIGYQDVLSIGRLIETGVHDFSRVVAIAGPRAKRPRLLRTIAGASLQELIGEESQPGNHGAPLCVLSGSETNGRKASWLGRYHHQITLLDDAPRHVNAPERGMMARFRRASQIPAPLVPTGALERALSFDVPVVPFLRALSVGDAETASRLGCLEMVEEDLAAVSLACTSGADYRRMLRHVLDELAEDA